MQGGEKKICMLGKCYSKYGRNIGIDVTMVHIYLEDRERDASLEETASRLRNRELDVSCLLRSP